MFCLECGTKLPDETSTCSQCGWELAATTPMNAASPPKSDERTAVAEALKDEYEIVDELGRGGMAIVYKGRELSLDREVAIKVLPFTFAFDNDFVERFQREARTAARLEHPHIIPIHRVGRHDNVIYFTMKFLRGESLARRLANRGALRPDEIRKLLIEAGGALGYAHQHDVVHRDIKPDNIMFTETGHSVVCDFGIAKAATESKLTGTGTAIGTPHYMSPEQARAQPLDGRSDLYSLGVVAYKCLTGKVPFDAEDSYAIGIKHITEPLPDPGLETDEQRAMFAIVERLLEKAPEDRFDSAEEMIGALESLPIGTGPSQSVSSVTPLPSAVEATEVSAPVTPTETPTTPMPRSSAQPAVAGPASRKKSKAPAMIGVIVVLGGAAGGYFALTNEGQVTPPGATPAATTDSVPVQAAANLPVDNPSVAVDSPPTVEPLPAATSTDRPVTAPPTQTSTPPRPNTTRPAVTERRPDPEPEPVREPEPVVRDTTPPVTDRPANVAPAQDSSTLRERVRDSVRARAEAAGMGRFELRGVRNGSRLTIGNRTRRGLGHNLPAGTYTIRITHPQYEPFVRQITIEAGEITRLEVEQQRKNNG